MDDQTLIEQLRSDADRLETGARDPGPLVRRAVAQGRRRRAHRRIGAAVGGLAAAAVMAVAVGTAAPLTLATPVPGPAGQPTSATSSPSRSARATTPASTGVVKASPDDVRDLVADLLPGSLTVTKSSAARDEGSNGFPWEYSAALTVKDGAGTSYLFAAIGNGSYGDGCLNLKDCTETTLPDGGTVWVTSSPAGDKAGLDHTFTYDRADGAHIFLMERNYADGDGPVTRSGLPLTQAEGRALVTSPEWDRLFRG